MPLILVYTSFFYCKFHTPFFNVGGTGSHYLSLIAVSWFFLVMRLPSQFCLGLIWFCSGSATWARLLIALSGPVFYKLWLRNPGVSWHPQDSTDESFRLKIHTSLLILHIISSEWNVLLAMPSGLIPLFKLKFKHLLICGKVSRARGSRNTILPLPM